MVRINLLPREAIEKRKFEQRIGYVIAAGLIAAAVVGVAFVGLLLVVNGTNNTLQRQLESNAQVQQQAQAYAIFEEKEATLGARSAVAQQALAGRIAWGQIANEVSLVLPDDLWVYRLLFDEDPESGMLYEGYALNPWTDVPDNGLKSLAKTLIRLADLPLVTSVWLEEASQEDYGYGSDDLTEPVLRFRIASIAVVPEAPESQDSTGVPAPPSQPAE
jgi:hypothetical protein